MKEHLLIIWKKKIFRFLIGGVLLTSYAFGINILLVEFVHLKTAISYAVVLTTLLLMGFFVNRFFVFQKGRLSVSKQFSLYVVLSFLFRFTDWLLYFLQVDLLSVYYLVAQSINYVIIVPTKFLVWRYIFEFKSNAEAFTLD